MSATPLAADAPPAAPLLPQPSPGTNPFPPASKVWQRPSGEIIPSFERHR